MRGAIEARNGPRLYELSLQPQSESAPHAGQESPFFMTFSSEQDGNADFDQSAVEQE